MTTYPTEKRYGMCAKKKNTERFGISPCIWCQDLPKEYKLRIRLAAHYGQYLNSDIWRHTRLILTSGRTQDISKRNGGG